jgi:MFS family permease
MPYINLYFERMGMSGTQIGFLIAIQVIALSATTLSWGTIADRYHIHKLIMCLGMLLTPVAMLMVATAQTFGSITVWVLVFAFFTSPIVPLIDSLAVDVAETWGGSYGAARVWGSLGWAISSWGIGLLVEQYNILWLFYGYAAFMWSAFLIALFQPKRLRQAPRLSFSLHLKGFLRIDLLLFLLSVFLLASSFSSVNSFFSIYMDKIGASETMIGLAWSIGSWTEIPIMLLGGWLIRKVGPGKLLTASFLLFALRWLLFSFTNSPGAALAIQFLHGISFACFAVGSITYMSRKSPAGLGATAQALLNMFTWGLGSIMGSLVGGYTYENFGMPVMFRVMFVFAISGLILFGFASQLKALPDEPKVIEPEFEG